MQRSYGNTVSVAYRHVAETGPFVARPDRVAACGQLDIGPLVHAQIHHGPAHFFCAQRIGDPCGDGVGRVDQGLGHVQAFAEIVAVLQGRSADLNIARIPPLREIAHDARIDGCRNAERFEGRTKLVNLVGHPVEFIIDDAAIHLVGIEFRQRGERHHFARIDVQHDACRAHRIGRQHTPAQFVFQRALNPHVDRQRHGITALGRDPSGATGAPVPSRHGPRRHGSTYPSTCAPREPCG